jgi:LCP family protein required for cell wall assembly
LATEAALAGALTRGVVTADELDVVVPGRPSVYLLIGSDRRADVGTAPGGVTEVRGQRADSVALVAVPPGGRPLRLLNLPRDLRVRVPGHGDQKLGGSYEYGSGSLVAAVRGLGAVVHHVIEVDFAGLTGVVDLMGGIPLDQPVPARDRGSGLVLPAGRPVLDGPAALAFVRSRDYQELRDGRWEYTEATDLGRISRQQRFLAALFAAAHDRLGVGELRRVAAEVGRHIAVDRSFGAADVRRWLRVLAYPAGGLDAHTLPTRAQVPVLEASSPFPPNHAGSVGYLMCQEPAAAGELAALARGSRGEGD